MKTGRGILLSILVLTFFVGSMVVVPTGTVHAQKVELSLGHMAPTTFYYHTLALRLKEMLEKKSGDKATVKVYPAGQLGRRPSRGPFPRGFRPGPLPRPGAGRKSKGPGCFR